MNIISLGPYLSSKTRVKKKIQINFLRRNIISVYWELFFQLRWKPRLGIWTLKPTFPKDLGKRTVFTTQEILLVIQLVSCTYTRIGTKVWHRSIETYIKREFNLPLWNIIFPKSRWKRLKKIQFSKTQCQHMCSSTFWKELRI